jgi:EAL domain-containing protein (putative c-di-GMP-specific phosphodiesterase class I)
VGLVLVGSDEDNPGALLSAADSACLAAQHTGGGRVTLFHEGDEDIARQREKMRWWVRAEQAVKAERLRLRCQRIARVDAIAGPPLHHEVLLSVYDENNAELPLGEFIGAAEAFGLMAELDRLVLSKALDWLHAHPREAGNLGGLAVNLSGQSLDDSSLVDFIRDRLTELAIPAGLLSFEVTETAAIANLDRAVAIIAGIRALGCRVALDDFGTGMSSYSYLKRLPVDYLKIDGSFVRDILNNPQDHAIVKSINETAHFMGKQTIAEYAESPEIITHLRNLGVDHVQGYALERPFYLDEIGTRHTAAR